MSEVFVVIELTGNSQEVDGAVIHGVYATLEAAQKAVAELPKGVVRDWVEIEQHELRGVKP